MQIELNGQGRPLNENEYLPQEKRLKNIQMLTFEGENAEAYLSYDNASLVFQRRGPDESCDQIYVMDITGNHMKRVSNGQGRTTCSYFLPDGSIIYATTAYNDPICPPPRLHIMIQSVLHLLIFPKVMYGHYIQHMISFELILQQERFYPQLSREIIMMPRQQFLQMERL